MNVHPAEPINALRHAPTPLAVTNVPVLMALH